MLFVFIMSLIEGIYDYFQMKILSVYYFFCKYAAVKMFTIFLYLQKI